MLFSGSKAPGSKGCKASSRSEASQPAQGDALEEGMEDDVQKDEAQSPLAGELRYSAEQSADQRS